MPKNFKTFILILGLASCTTQSLHDKEESNINVYNSVLDEIITEKYYVFCLTGDRWNAINKAFNNGILDTTRFLKEKDSLISVQKKILPKCKIDYDTQFFHSTENGLLDANNRKYIKKYLKTDFANLDFSSYSTDAIIDTIMKPAPIKAMNLSINYMDIAPHEGTKFRPWGDGLGVISFSRIFFNKKGDKGVLYFEFRGGPKNAVGDLLFIDKVDQKWIVRNSRVVWRS